MKNLPLFTTEHGVASLTLREIPYSGKAYIRIQDSVEPEALLRECVDFCKMVGAERIYATGEGLEEFYPLHTEIVILSCAVEQLTAKDAKAVQLDAQNLSLFRDIYNAKMQNVPNASYMSLLDAQALLDAGSGSIVYRDDIMLGIGITSDNRIEMIASVVPGSGADVLCALCRNLSGDSVEVEVATGNETAVAFYKRLGFQFKESISKWYKIF